MVVEYLREHPDLLRGHPDLLASLDLAHACGSAQSLIEHQVVLLRSDNTALKRRLAELVQNARENEALRERLHRLTLSLLGCLRLDEIFATLYQALAEEFEVDRVSIRLFATPTTDLNRGLGEFVDSSDGALGLFEDALAHAKPVCGPLAEEQRRFLFGEAGVDVKSCALLPLTDMGCVGLLAIGSEDVERFKVSMGTAFLRHVAEIVSNIVAPHLKEPAAKAG
jgi:uncharacterized protein YigA (DUF484 family)